MNSQLTPGLNDIFAYIDEHAEMFLQRLIEYLRRPSISAYGEGIGEVADYIAGVMRQMGLAVRVMPTDGWPMVFGEYHARPAAPTVLLYGHYDVQPPDPLEEWVSPPFEPTVRGGNVYAQGACDNKGQLLAGIKAAEYAFATGGPPVNLRFLIEGEEEISCTSLPKFIRAN